MKTSVSNSMASVRAKFFHRLIHGFVVPLVAAKKRMIRGRHLLGWALRNKAAFHFPPLYDQHFLSTIQGFEDALHPITKIHYRRFHV